MLLIFILYIYRFEGRFAYSDWTILYMLYMFVFLNLSSINILLPPTHITVDTAESRIV